MPIAVGEQALEIVIGKVAPVEMVVGGLEKAIAELERELVGRVVDSVAPLVVVPPAPPGGIATIAEVLAPEAWPVTEPAGPAGEPVAGSATMIGTEAATQETPAAPGPVKARPVKLYLG